MVRLALAALAGGVWSSPLCEEDRDLLLRFSKGYAERGDDSFRLTLLDKRPVIDVKKDGSSLHMSSPRRIELHPELTTSAEVRANWSSFWYQSSTFDVAEKTNLKFSTSCGERSVQLRNPGRGQGHVSVVFGDPYYGPDLVGEAPVYVNISRQLPGMVNQLAEFESVHSLGILGDFWYELAPADSMHFNRQLSLKAKSLMTYSILGNHDYWQAGRALDDGVHRAQNGRNGSMPDFVHGYGWTQFWGMDTLGTFDNEAKGQEAYAHETFMKAQSKVYNDVTYTQDKPIEALPMEFSSSYFVHGNMGYILFSGVWSFEEQKEWLGGACQAMERDDVAVIWLVSHWSEDIHNPRDEGFVGHACGADLSVRRTFDHIAAGELGTDSPCYRAYQVGQLKFINGHDHWNDCVKEQELTMDGVTTSVCAGWQVAGAGKGSGTLDGTLPPDQTTIDCPQCDDSEFTIAAVDSRDGKLQLGFLQMVSNMTDRSQDWADCFQRMGDDFSFDFVVNHCQAESPLVHIWSQPLRPLFTGTQDDMVIV